MADVVHDDHGRQAPAACEGEGTAELHADHLAGLAATAADAHPGQQLGKGVDQVGAGSCNGGELLGGDPVARRSPCSIQARFPGGDLHDHGAQCNGRTGQGDPQGDGLPVRQRELFAESAVCKVGDGDFVPAVERALDSEEAGRSGLDFDPGVAGVVAGPVLDGAFGGLHEDQFDHCAFDPPAGFRIHDPPGDSRRPFAFLERGKAVEGRRARCRRAQSEPQRRRRPQRLAAPAGGLPPRYQSIRQIRPPSPAAQPTRPSGAKATAQALTPGIGCQLRPESAV